MTTRKTLFKILITGLSSLLICSMSIGAVFADGKFSVSPMNQKIVLTPGETYRGSFKVANPATNANDFSYKAAVSPFYVSEDYEPIYENNGDYTQMVEWIEIDNPEGVIAPNNVIELLFSINVPKNAPAGGQYAAIAVTSNDDSEPLEKGINIDMKFSITHIIYAEVAGTTERQGDIFNVNVPSFIFDGNITATSSVKNTGNVHGTAKYTLQIFPLFSGEEIYTTEEEPTEKTILPDRILTNNIEWADTPIFGLFNVKYTVEFEGVTTEVSKLVIKCPLWLLFIAIFIIIALIVWIVIRVKMCKKSQDE